MPRFFIKKENIEDKNIFIRNISDINHIINVLRCKKNDELIFSCEDGMVYEAKISSLEKNEIETQIVSSYKSDKILKTHITLAQSIIKSQKQDFVIQKATELGVKKIIPFISKNTVVKLENEKDKASKVNRWQKIVYESVKQCRRGDIAEVAPVATFEEVLSLEGYDLKIVASEKEDKLSLKSFLESQKLPENPSVLIIIGPEGGWDDKEIKKFCEKGITSVTLGKLVYRAETAVAAVISQLIYCFEL